MKIGDVREVEIQYPAPCLTCEELIEPGTWAKWCKGVGIWHVECGRPRNLEHFIQQAQQPAVLGSGKRHVSLEHDRK